MRYNLAEVPEDKIHYYYGGHCGRLPTEVFHDLISKCGTDVKIHVNLQTIVSEYINSFKYDERYVNLQLLCNEKEFYPILSEIYKGAYDIKNKTYWFNRYTPIKIVTDDDVDNGHSLIIRDDEVVGYCYSI
jgi:hypothetical protein